MLARLLKWATLFLVLITLYAVYIGIEEEHVIYPTVYQILTPNMDIHMSAGCMPSRTFDCYIRLSARSDLPMKCYYDSLGTPRISKNVARSSI